MKKHSFLSVVTKKLKKSLKSLFKHAVKPFNRLRKVSWWRLLGGGLLLATLAIFWVFVIGISSNQPGSYYDQGQNAVWLGHRWVGEELPEAEIRELVENLKKQRIGTVFVHSGPFGSDGDITPEVYAYAPRFLELARKYGPEIQYQAWLGQIRGEINLALADVRHNAAKEAMIMSQLVGFDGVHFDIEPIWDGDLFFIELLEESRELMPEDKVISVAVAELIPGLVVWGAQPWHQFKNYNTEVNFRNLAEYADQIVVMVYDTGIEEERWYKWLVKEQTIWLSNILEGKAELFVGVPAYDDDTTDSHFEVESLGNALEGVVDGLNNLRSEEETFAGVSIYSYWEIDDEEWADYRRIWLDENEGASEYESEDQS